MPQYYLPLIRFLKFYITVFIRDFVSTGRVSLDEFTHPNIKSYCSITGGQCTPSCPRFSFDTPCKHLIKKQSAYTIGIIYVLVNLNYTNIVQERDFYTAIHTGKLYSEMLDDYEPYNFVDDNTSVSFKSQIKPLTLSKTKYKYIPKRIKRFNESRNKELENTNKLIENFKETKGKVPSNLISLRNNLEQEIQDVSQLPAETLFTWIGEYLDGSSSFNLVKEIVDYFINEFTAINNDDFPYGALKAVKEGTLQNLIAKTKDLDDKNPMKWTDKRYRQYIEETDPYKRLLLLDDNLLIWKSYMLDDITPTESLIRTKYLIDKLLHANISIGRTTFFIYSDKLNDACYTFRLYKLIKYIIKQSKLTVENFFTLQQIKYQAILKPKANPNEYLPIYHTIMLEKGDDLEHGKILINELANHNFVKVFSLIHSF